MKRNRQEKMLELISRYEIDTQDELIARLRDCGFEVTQATVSRDIRELKISKMMTGKGSYRYVLPKQTATGSGQKFSTALIDSIVTVESACNIVVIKTYPGLASAVAGYIDSQSLPEILGTIAGDDAIFVVVRDASRAGAFCEKIKGMLAR